MFQSRLLLALCLAAVCAGCGQAPEPAPTNQTETPPAAAVTPTPAVMPGAEGPTLAPLQAEDGNALRGELACSFGNGDRMLLLARGNVAADERTSAVVRIDGAPRTLTSTGVGGYSALEKGAIFARGALKITIAPGTHMPDTGEEVVQRTTLTLRQAGIEQKIDGRWRCGP